MPRAGLRVASILLSLASLTVACRRESVDSRRLETRGTAPAGQQVSRKAPLSKSERSTTSGEIAMRNLEGEIVVLEARFAAGSRNVKELTSLVDLLMTRAVCRGRLSDYERVHELGEEAVRVAPRDPEALLLRARARAVLHDFDGALADAGEAERAGASPRQVGLLRAEALQELGRADEALEIRGSLNRERPELFALATEAALRAERGDLETPERLFIDAQHAYRDLSPFPFAWLYFRHGLVSENAGNPQRARELYLAALERMPGYVPAVARLAELEAQAGRRKEAIALLRDLVASSDDPEHAGRLAALVDAEGQTEEAERLRATAAARFDELVALRPGTFAAKAAAFWLGPGGDAEKALRLAELNLTARQTPEDLKLVADARAAVASR